MINLKIVIFFFIFSNIVLANQVKTPKSNNIAKAVFIKGKVQYSCPKMKNTKLLKKGVKLQDGCEISIGKTQKALAVIGFGENFQSKMKLVKNSWVKITKEKHGEVKKGEMKIVDTMVLKAGSLLINYNNKNRNKNSLQVKTKSASLGVRGTEFFTYNDESDNLSMTVDSGEVNVKSNEGEEAKSVKNGNGTIVAKDGSVPDPKKMDWSEKVNWEVDPKKGELNHNGDLFLEIEQQYKKWNEDILKQKKKYQEDIDDQKKRMWGN